MSVVTNKPGYILTETDFIILISTIGVFDEILVCCYPLGVFLQAAGYPVFLVLKSQFLNSNLIIEEARAYGSFVAAGGIWKKFTLESIVYKSNYASPNGIFVVWKLVCHQTARTQNDVAKHLEDSYLHFLKSNMTQIKTISVWKIEEQTWKCYHDSRLNTKCLPLAGHRKVGIGMFLRIYLFNKYR